jgi:hypothetical protein
MTASALALVQFSLRLTARQRSRAASGGSGSGSQQLRLPAVGFFELTARPRLSSAGLGCCPTSPSSPRSHTDRPPVASSGPCVCVYVCVYVSEGAYGDGGPILAVPRSVQEFPGIPSCRPQAPHRPKARLMVDLTPTSTALTHTRMHPCPRPLPCTPGSRGVDDTSLRRASYMMPLDPTGGRPDACLSVFSSPSLPFWPFRQP